MITSRASEKIRYFNKIGLHYNLTADAIYKIRNSIIDPFGITYMPYIIAGLISFDMGRMMGPDAAGRYDPGAGGFATLLQRKLNTIRRHLSHLVDSRIDILSLDTEAGNIKKAYDILSSAGEESLNRKGGGFYVGASKILHFLNPQAFIVVDSNAARAFKQLHNVSFRNATQPGYSGDKYIQCMKCAKKDIIEFGVREFCALEPGIPIARIYDKLTFVTGLAQP